MREVFNRVKDLAREKNEIECRMAQIEYETSEIISEIGTFLSESLGIEFHFNHWDEQFETARYEHYDNRKYYIIVIELFNLELESVTCYDEKEEERIRKFFDEWLDI